MHWLKNTWYQAGWANEVNEGELLTRTILDMPLVFYRKPDGNLAALLDRCPHRFAPLSQGHVDGDNIICGYHGLGFGGNGECSRNPHGSISKGMKVESFKVVERDTAIWIWLGDADAEMGMVPDLSFIENAPEHGRIFGYMPTKANYQLVTDNILDLSHADYLHPTTLGGMMTNSEFLCTQEDDVITLQWDSSDQNVPGAFAPDIPPPLRGDFSIRVQWYAPARMILNIAAKPHSDTRFDPEDYSPTLHNMTPETETSTHYFFCSTRPKNTPPPEVMAIIKEATERAFFDEDKPMLEAQQKRIGSHDFWAMKPRMLPIDEGAVRVRQRLDALIKAEREAG